MAEPLLEVTNLTHRYRLNRTLSVPALDGVSFQLQAGEIFGLVGESGSGKSTAARCVMNLLRPTGGQIRYKGVDILDPRQFRTNRTLLQTTRQIIFQDSSSSLNPRMTVGQIIAEPMVIHRITPPRDSLRAEAEFQLQRVGLDGSFLERRPLELSGGQRQRVAVARALSMEPELLVADEPVAALDVSIQAQLLNLFRHLQREHGFTLLFIAHDLSVVKYLCDRVGVLYRGRLVELAPAPELFVHPLHPYTRALLSAIPIPDPRLERARVPIAFDGDGSPPKGVFREVSPKHFVLMGEEAGQ